MTDTEDNGLMERDTVTVDGVEMPIWPNGKLGLKKFDKEAVLGVNSDLPALHQPLIDAMVEMDARQRIEAPRERCTGGQKLRDLHLLRLPIRVCRSCCQQQGNLCQHPCDRAAPNGRHDHLSHPVHASGDCLSGATASHLYRLEHQSYRPPRPTEP